MPYKHSFVTESFSYQCAMTIFQYQSYSSITVWMFQSLFQQFLLEICYFQFLAVANNDSGNTFVDTSLYDHFLRIISEGKVLKLTWTSGSKKMYIF